MLLVVGTSFVLNEASVDEVSCERIKILEWRNFGNQKTCFMTDTTSINVQGLKISAQADEMVCGLRFTDNEKVSFLPNNVHKKFPNLLGFDAFSCSIKSVSRENFKGLKRLEELWLGANRIEKIMNNTFLDLTSLKRLNLGKKGLLFVLFSILFLKFSHVDKNKIKFLNGATFNHLNRLEKVWLSENDCIDKNFEGQNEILRMLEDVTAKCSFNESDDENEQKTFQELFDKQKREIESLEKFIKTIVSKKNQLQYEITQHLIKIKNLEAELEAMKSTRNYELHEA